MAKKNMQDTTNVPETIETDRVKLSPEEILQ